MPRNLLMLALLFALPWLTAVAAAEGDSSADAGEEEDRIDVREIRPPIGVFGERVHAKGDVKLSYRYQRTGLDGLLSGTQMLDASDILTPGSGYTATATRLDINTNTFEAMWVPFQEVTLVLSLPYITKTMTWVDTTLGQYLTRASGFGDLDIQLLYHVFENETNRIHLNLGISLPSGSSTVSDVVNGAVERQPYQMQLGSGTVDLTPGFTYNGQWGRTSWGAQLNGTLHAGTNDEGYKLGNQYRLNGWLGRRLFSWLDVGFRLKWQQWFNPTGEDVLMPPNTPQRDPSRQAGRRLDALFSMDVYMPEGFMHGVRLALESGLPAYQSLAGPQLRTKWFLTLGLQYAF